MDVNTVNLILWAPFALVGLLTALIYCIKGLRKGIKPALVSLAAIIAAAFLSIFIARALAGLITPALQGAIPAGAFELSDMLMLLILSVISTLAAMALFMMLFLILTPIIAAIGKTILRKKTEPAPVSGGSKAGGAALGLVSALLFTMILLLPIYGSLAAYAPMARSALDMIPDMSVDAKQESYSLQPLSATVRPLDKETAPAPDSDLQLLREILDCILQHPLVELSSSAPVQTVYTSLSQVNVEQAPVNLSDMAAAMEELMNKIAAVTQADDAHRAEACRELVTFCREEVLTQDWAYTVYVLVLEEVSDSLEDEPAADEVLDILTFDDEEFRTNADAILDFAEAVLEKDVLEQLEQGNFAALADSGLLAETGKLLNATEQMVKLKNLFYRVALEAVAEGRAEKVRAFVEKYPLEQLTDPAQQVQEAEAFCALAGSGDADPMEFFLQHPSLGQKALQELMIAMGITA